MTAFALITGAIFVLAVPVALIPRSRPRPEFTGGLPFLWWLNQLYTRGLHRLEVENEAPLPASGPAILISNHTCGIDHLILQAGTNRLLGFMIAQEFYDYPVYRPFCKAINCIPVRRDGHDAAAVRTALRALKEGRVLPIFPEGKINPTSGREFHEPKSGAAYLALRAGVPVIPAYIRGTPATDGIVKALTTPSDAHLVFGPPIDLSDLRSGETKRDEHANLAVATDRLMNAIKALRDQAVGLPPAAPEPTRPNSNVQQAREMQTQP